MDNSQRTVQEIRDESNDTSQPEVLLLVNEHRILMQARVASRLINRVLVVAVIIFTSTQEGLLSNKYLCIALTWLVSLFWYLQEQMTFRNISLIEKVIVGRTRDYWAHAFTDYRHMLWSKSRIEFIQRFEPIIWLLASITLLLANLIL